jgi:hypothetical protein
MAATEEHAIAHSNNIPYTTRRNDIDPPHLPSSELAFSGIAKAELRPGSNCAHLVSVISVTVPILIKNLGAEISPLV